MNFQGRVLDRREMQKKNSRNLYRSPFSLLLNSKPHMHSETPQDWVKKKKKQWSHKMNNSQSSHRTGTHSSSDQPSREYSWIT